MKVCSVDGCTKTLRAKGLCSTHYNQQHQPDRHRRATTRCVVCGASVQRALKAGRQPTCSVQCRTVVQSGHPPYTTGWDWAYDAMKRARREGATVIDRIERLDVMQRDGWRCYLCAGDLDPERSPFDPAFPTVDHVVPLSCGGEHSMRNVRACCLRCNSAKQDRLAA